MTTAARRRAHILGIAARKAAEANLESLRHINTVATVRILTVVRNTGTAR